MPLGIDSKIAPQVLADTVGGENASVVILLTDQADVSAAYGMNDPDARGWFVYNTLTQHAARCQAGLLSPVLLLASVRWTACARLASAAPNWTRPALPS